MTTPMTIQLRVNGQPWTQRADGTYSYLEGMRFDTLERRFETTAPAPVREHMIGIHADVRTLHVSIAVPEQASSDDEQGRDSGLNTDEHRPQGWPSQ